MRWSSVSESERASGASADDRTRNCGSETRGVTLARRSLDAHGEAASCLLYIIHLNAALVLVEEERPSSPSLRSLFCQDLRLSGSTPGSYYPPLRLGWVVISCPLWAIVGSGVESIIDNYKRRSPAWSSFLCGPEGQTFFLRRACHRPRRLRLRHGLRTQRRRRRRLHVVRRGRQSAKSQYMTTPATSSWASKTRAGSRPPPASFHKADTHLKRVARIADYAFKAAALRGAQNEGPGSGDACGDGRSSRGVVATARDGASSVRAGRRWRTSFVSESLVRPPEPLEGPPRCCGGGSRAPGRWEFEAVRARLPSRSGRRGRAGIGGDREPHSGHETPADAPPFLNEYQDSMSSRLPV